MLKTKIYSPKQIQLGSFLGGPLAMLYFLKMNFDALGNKKGSKMVLIWGSVFNLLLFASLPFLSSIKFPHYVLPVAYAIAAMQIAEKYQLSKQYILDSSQYGFQSNWNIVGVSVVGIIAFAVIYGLPLLGLISVGLL